MATYGVNDIFLYGVQAFPNQNDIKLVDPTKPAVIGGWVPAWRNRHDPKELERRLEAQRGLNSRASYDRFLRAEEAARRRAAEAKSAKQRAALQDAVDSVADSIFNALDANTDPPEELINILEAAANATRVSASIKNAERAVAMAIAWAEFEDEEEIEMLLLH